MKEKLIELLKLDAKATEDQIIAAIEQLHEHVEVLQDENAEMKKALQSAPDRGLETAIAKKIAQSGGALSREQAILSIEEQARHDKQRKGKK